eukprot:TRINITY_DN4569_c0_g1_i1.p2 TRINITY_DN4569_c0_g1~~TRINITY_DN4569_c0_g1_i1.p2  ORF type:complete len:597 (+),score=44.60 TRINITY_DN4569_c0_g1_i1:90-1793(+)
MAEDKTDTTILTAEASSDTENKPFIHPEEKYSTDPSSAHITFLQQPVLEDSRVVVSQKILEGKYWPIFKLIKDNKLPVNLLVDPRNKWYLIHFIITHGKPSKLKVLLEKFKADPNIQDNYGQTPLHLATTHCRIQEIVLLTQDPRIIVDKQDILGCTPIINCVKTSFLLGFIYLYFERNANLAIRDANGSSIVHWAALRNNVPLLKLIRHIPGLDFDLPDNEGMTPLQKAISSMSYDSTKYLLSSANPQNGETLTVEKLQKYEATVNNHPHIKEKLHEAAITKEFDEKGFLSTILSSFSFEKVSDAVTYIRHKHGTSFFFSFVMAFIIALTFTFYQFYNHATSFGYIASLALFLLSLGALVCKKDPGYLPKKMLNDPNNAVGTILENLSINETDQQYCFECLIVQSRSIYHCEKCGKCVAGFHCHLKPWLGGICIGENNFRFYFFSQLFATFALWFYLAGVLNDSLTVPTSTFPVSFFEKLCMVWEISRLLFAVSLLAILAMLQISYNVFVMLVAGSLKMTLHELIHAHKHKYLFSLASSYGQPKRYVWTTQSFQEKIQNLKEFFKV